MAARSSAGANTSQLIRTLRTETAMAVQVSALAIPIRGVMKFEFSRSQRTGEGSTAIGLPRPARASSTSETRPFRSSIQRERKPPR